MFVLKINIFRVQDLVVSGVFKFHCQVTKSLKTATKLVRVSTALCGDELVSLLADKFNLGEINTAEFVVFGVVFPRLLL